MKTCNNCGTKQIDNRKTCVECNQKFGEKSINILEQKEKDIQSTKFDKIIGIINILDVYKRQIQNLSISTILTGNKYGCQFFDLRVNEDYSSFVHIEIINNYLKIWQKLKEEEQEMLFTLNLDEHDGLTYKTIGKDREDSLEAAKKIKKGQITIAETNSENDSLEYIPEIKRNDTAKRNINIQLANDNLTVMIDDKQAAEVKINVFDAGEIYLGSVWGGKDFEDNNNRVNTIYDAVFENLYIEETKDDSITLLYDNTLNKFQTFMEYLYAFWRIIRNIS